ncbi:hypothetical protein AVEN_16916-1 [Araneus ventricosus]|uniref:Uncharacterized protein n=1 Tax=Araneus ventricosus TaxID=182803 RepID=A0A4Y2J8G6_ARAVE|nr:hypothetical protein AVEN_16916-1 [Araneus ventricosus]
MALKFNAFFKRQCNWCSPGQPLHNGRNRPTKWLGYRPNSYTGKQQCTTRLKGRQARPTRGVCGYPLEEGSKTKRRQLLMESKLACLRGIEWISKKAKGIEEGKLKGSKNTWAITDCDDHTQQKKANTREGTYGERNIIWTADW